MTGPAGLAGWRAGTYAAPYCIEVGMEVSPEHSPQDSTGQGGPDARAAARGRARPWYAGEHKDTLFYLLIAVLFVEMIVGGVSFFYGLMHAAPQTPGGPPVARFPWLVWGLTSVLAPVALLLVVHLTGRWLSHTLDEGREGGADNPENAAVPERLRHFYAMVRSAPTVVLLLGILLLGAGLFFVDGAFSALVSLGGALTPYIPWIAGSAAGLLAVCFLIHRWFAYRQRRMEQEYAFRREVLERTGIVLVDKGCVPLPQHERQRAMLVAAESAKALPPVLDVDGATPDAREARPLAQGEGADEETAMAAGPGPVPPER